MTDIRVLYGETEATVWAGFRVDCFSCGRTLSALSRKQKPAELPTEDAVCEAAKGLLGELGCVVGAWVTCSYCASPKLRGKERYIDLDSWEIRVTGDQQPVARADWLIWPEDEA